MQEIVAQNATILLYSLRGHTHLNQRLQLSQLAVLQLEQGLPPRGMLAPLSLLEKEAQGEITRLALLQQRGQEASSSR